jgi:hypothetical protein
MTLMCIVRPPPRLPFAALLPRKRKLVDQQTSTLHHGYADMHRPTLHIRQAAGYTVASGTPMTSPLKDSRKDRNKTAGGSWLTRGNE